MIEDIKPIIIKPANYLWIVVGMAALLTWQTILLIQTIMAKGIQGSSSQVMVYLLVLGLAFALKESAIKPIYLMDHHCNLKTVMAKEMVVYKDIEKIELISKKGQMRTTHDLKLVKENPVVIKDIGVYSKSDIEQVVKIIGGGSAMTPAALDELIEKLSFIRFTKL